ncbi:hypothetical protein R9C00_07065 [Flammeovirgaceae bacterium SG7u.111]|nr:hypothetical protein R9C00_07065 [Flammeovirgaceae bacterium SG7u.111]
MYAEIESQTEATTRLPFWFRNNTSRNIKPSITFHTALVVSEMDMAIDIHIVLNRTPRIAAMLETRRYLFSVTENSSLTPISEIL